MLRRFVLLLLVPFLLLATAVAQRPVPGGWQEMTSTIYATDIRNIASLQGQTFVLDLSTVGSSLTLEPAKAFDLKLLADGKMQVTVVKPSVLLDDDKVFTKFRAISFVVIGVDSTFHDGAIQGDVSCLYRLRFRQTGAKELNLSSLPSSYKVTWENNGAQLVIRQEGNGLTAERSAGDTAAASVRLHVLNAPRKLDLTTDWIDVPACVRNAGMPAAVTEAVVGTPPVQRMAGPSSAEATTPPAIEESTGRGTVMQAGPAIPVAARGTAPASASQIAAAQCLSMSVMSMTPCKSCGSVYVTQEVSFTNHCARPVRCDGMQRSVVAQGVPIVTDESSIQVDAMLSRVQTLVSQAVSRIDAYTVSPPSGGTCRFLDGANQAVSTY